MITYILYIYYICITYILHTHNEKYYYKELAQKLMVAEKSHNLQSITWRLRKANGVNSSPSLKAWEREHWCKFPFKGRSRPMSQLNQSGRENSTCLHFVLCQPSEAYPPPLGRAICFTQSTNSNPNLFQRYTNRHTQK